MYNIKDIEGENKMEEKKLAGGYEFAGFAKGKKAATKFKGLWEAEGDYTAKLGARRKGGVYMIKVKKVAGEWAKKKKACTKKRTCSKKK